MQEQKILRELLQQHFDGIRSRNPSFSARAFARKLGLPAPACSELMRGVRPFTKAMATRIVTRLSLPELESQRILKMFEGQIRPRASHAGTQAPERRLTDDQFSIIAEWQHYAIRALLGTHPAPTSDEEIASRLGLGLETTREALERLLRLGMIHRLEDGSLRSDSTVVLAGDRDASSAIRQAHREDLRLADRSLSEDPMEIRDLFSMTVAVDPDKVPMARDMIRQFHKDLVRFLQAGERSSVYLFGTKLIPLSDREALAARTREHSGDAMKKTATSTAKRLLLALAFPLILGSVAYAGGGGDGNSGKGNGGDLISCQTTKRSSAISFSADFLAAQSLPLLAGVLASDQERGVLDIASRLGTINGDLEREFLNFAEDAGLGVMGDKRSRWIADADLIETTDLKDEAQAITHPMFRGQVCRGSILQTVIHRNGKYYFHPDRVAALRSNSDQWVWLLVHEWNWNHVENSDDNAAVNALLHSDLTGSELRESLAERGFRFK